MPKLDIANPADFSRITQQTITDLAALGGLDPTEWTLLEASYNDIKFLVFTRSTIANRPFSLNKPVNWNGAVGRISDTGGRRLVKYSYPYQDGQTTDDLGRKPGSFEFEIVIFGEHYLEGYEALLDEFDDPIPGKLIHPIRGEITCKAETVNSVHEHSARKAVTMNVTFVEHNFTIGDITKVPDGLVKTIISAALVGFKIIDTAINKIQQAVMLQRGLKNRISLLLASYKASYAAVLTAMNLAFNQHAGSTDIPMLLPVNLGGTGTQTAANGGLALSGNLAQDLAQLLAVASTDNFVVTRSISDPFNGIPVDALNQSTVVALAIPAITKTVIALRDQLQVILDTIKTAPEVPAGSTGTAGAPGIASLELIDTIDQLLQTSVFMQDTLEAGIKSSKARIVDFLVPRVMSLREAAFINGLTVARTQELDALNPQLDSVNYLAKGITIKVPIE